MWRDAAMTPDAALGAFHEGIFPALRAGHMLPVASTGRKVCAQARMG